MRKVVRVCDRALAARSEDRRMGGGGRVRGVRSSGAEKPSSREKHLDEAEAPRRAPTCAMVVRSVLKRDDARVWIG